MKIDVRIALFLAACGPPSSVGYWEGTCGEGTFAADIDHSSGNGLTATLYLLDDDLTIGMIGSQDGDSIELSGVAPTEVGGGTITFDGTVDPPILTGAFEQTTDGESYTATCSFTGG